MRTPQQTYLSVLRWDTPLHIVLIVMLVGSVLLPVAQEAVVAVLFAGMILRARRCSACATGDRSLSGRGAVLLFPLWPAFVLVDDLWDWMHRVGFSSTFRIPVTAVLFAVAWIPFLDVNQTMVVGAIGLAATITAVLRDSSTSWYYLLPTLIPVTLVSNA